MALPGDLVNQVARLAGLGARQLSRALEVAFGPLHGLRPDGIKSSLEMRRLLRSLARHPALKALDLTHVGRFVGDSSMQQLADSLPALQQLTVGRRCHHLTSAGLADVARLKELTALDLSEWTEFSAGSLAIVTQLTRLRSLSFECSSIFVTAVEAMPLASLSGLQQLSHLQLGSMIVISPEGMYRLLEATASLPHLAALHLNGMPVSGSDTSASLLAGHRALKSLVVECGDGSEDDDAVASLLAAIGGMTDLEQLSITAFVDNEDVLSGCLSRFSRLRSLTPDLFCTVPLEGIVRANPLTKLRLLGDGDSYSLQQLQCLTQLRSTLQVLHLSQREHLHDCLQFAGTFVRLADLAITYLGHVHAPWAMPHLALPSLTSLCIKGRDAWPVSLGPEQLASLTSLRQLSLVRCGVDDAAAACLTSLQLLEVLDVSNNQRILGPGLQSVLRLPCLKQLSLPVNLATPDTALAFLDRYLLPLPATLCRCRVDCVSFDVLEQCLDALGWLCDVSGVVRYR
jgi:hypothetical protein